MLMTKLTILFFTLIYATQSFSQYKATTAEERARSAEKRKILQQSTYLKDVKFRNIGPTIMSGRVIDLDVNPSDPTEFYAAFATGGLWHTRNNGLSFTPVFDQNPNL